MKKLKRGQSVLIFIRSYILVSFPFALIDKLAYFIGISSNSMPFTSIEVSFIYFSILVFHDPKCHLPIFKISLENIASTENIFTYFLIIIFPLSMKLVSIVVSIYSLAISFSIANTPLIDLFIFEFYNSKTIKIVFTKLSFVLNLNLWIIVPLIETFSWFLWHMNVTLIVIAVFVIYTT